MESNSAPLIDHTYDVETPEGIRMHAELAGVIPRAGAFLIDIAIRTGVLFALFIVWSFLGKVGGGLALICWFLIEWFYPVLFEVLADGQTPGKKKMGLVVLNDDLTPANWRTSTLRNLLRAVDMLPFGYLFGAVSVLTSKNFQRLGDLVAGTIVVHKQEETIVTEMPEVEPTIPELDLSQQDRQALVAFTQRHSSMTPERAEELAAILTPVTGRFGEDNKRYLYGVGSWLLGAKP